MSCVGQSVIGTLDMIDSRKARLSDTSTRNNLNERRRKSYIQNMSLKVSAISCCGCDVEENEESVSHQ